MKQTFRRFGIASRAGIMAVVIALPLFSCEDETLSENEEQQSEQIINDEALADDLFEDMDAISMEAASYSENGRILSGSLADLSCLSRSVNQSLSSGKYTKEVTLDFSDDCSDAQGRNRSGKLVVNHVIDASTYTLSTKFDGFIINGNKLDGTRTLVYSQNDKGVLSATITLVDGKITLADGSVITREGSFTKEIDAQNGKVVLSGKAEGTNRNGVGYVAQITTPLVFKTSCLMEGSFMAVSGNKEITRVDRKALALDYGDGSCDNTVRLNIDGVESTIDITINK